MVRLRVWREHDYSPPDGTAGQMRMKEHDLSEPWAGRTGVRRGPAIAALALALAVAAASAVLALLLRTPPSAPQPVAPTPPTPRFGAAMAYDPAAREVILFGGDDRQTALADTWRWDGRQWIELHPASSPPGLVNPMLGYDPASRRLVLAGGARLAGGTLHPQAGSWTWDGSTWVGAPAGAVPPEAAEGAGTALATDEGSGQLILVTGAGSCQGFQTWRWAGNRWLMLHPASSPAPGLLDQLGYDPRSRRLLLFSAGAGCLGGPAVQASGLWAWDGTTWHAETAPATSQAPVPGEPSESAQGLLVQTPSSTFLWDGSGWDEAAMTGAEIVEPAIAYDAVSREVILYGGICMSCGTVAPLDETWTWDGSWRLRGGTPAPPT
jgi:hypothetical protein